MSIMKIVKSKDNKNISFLEGDTNIACLDIIKLRNFLNNEITEIEEFENKVMKKVTKL